MLPSWRCRPPRRDRAFGTTLNELLARLQLALVRQRAFVADASHELRTPLANLRTELELANRPHRSRADLATAVDNAAEETHRLSVLAEDLLLLARGDDDPPIVRAPTPRASAMWPRVGAGSGWPSSWLSPRCTRDDSAEQARSKLSAMVEGDPSVIARLESLMGLTENPGEPEDSFRALQRALSTMAQRTPLVLIIDDLQWAQPPLLELIDGCVARSRACQF